MFRRLTLWLLLVGMLGGCQKRETSSTAGTKPSAGGVRVVYIPKNTGNPYFNGVTAGSEKGCREFGVEFFTTRPAVDIYQGQHRSVQQIGRAHV